MWILGVIIALALVVLAIALYIVKLRRYCTRMFSEANFRTFHSGLSNAIEAAKGKDADAVPSLENGSAFLTEAGLAVCVTFDTAEDGSGTLTISMSEPGSPTMHTVFSRFGFFALVMLQENKAECTTFFTQSGVHYLVFRFESQDQEVRDYDDTYAVYMATYKPLPFEYQGIGRKSIVEKWLKKMKTLRLLLTISLGWLLVKGVSVLVRTSSTDRILLEKAGLTWLFWVLTPAILVLFAVALYYVWRPSQIGYRLAQVGVLLDLAESLIGMIIGIRNPEVLRDAIVVRLTARGLPVRPEQLDWFGTPLMDVLMVGYAIVVCVVLLLALFFFERLRQEYRGYQSAAQHRAEPSPLQDKEE